jgi:hypothetical protein
MRKIPLNQLRNNLVTLSDLIKAATEQAKKNSESADRLIQMSEPQRQFPVIDLANCARRRTIGQSLNQLASIDRQSEAGLDQMRITHQAFSLAGELAKLGHQSE